MSSQRHALSDNQVAGELRKMTAFIRQEAVEKSKEIHIKADEEFAIEKSKLVRHETAAIDALYEKRFKQAAMSQQIKRSTLVNNVRLRVLSARQELLDELFERARLRVDDASRADPKRLRTVLRDLILEGAYALNEDEILVQARTKDRDLVVDTIEDAKRKFQSEVGRAIAADIDDAHPLPDGSYVLSYSRLYGCGL